MKKKLRKIVISHETYLWKIETKYVQLNSEIRDFTAKITVTVYREGFRNSPLKVHFETVSDPIIGTVLTSHAFPENLYKPSNIETIITKAIQQGWDHTAGSFTIRNGLDLIL